MILKPLGPVALRTPALLPDQHALSVSYRVTPVPGVNETPRSTSP